MTVSNQDGHLQMPVAGDIIAQHYEVLELISSGGWGHVFKVRHQALDKVCAAKVLQVDQQSRSDIERFLQEARIVSQIKHPNVVSIDCFVRDERFGLVLVMEYLNGVTLSEVMKDKRPLLNKVELFNQLCKGLAMVHASGVIHRDLKPSNVIVVGERAVLIDFGIARHELSSQKLTATEAFVGTPLYMSPEYCMSKTVDVRSDIYSLGCLLFEMVTGRPPFEGGTALEVMTQHLTALPQYRAADELSRRLEPVVLRCLNKDPNGRFQTVEELQDDVNRVLRGVTLEPHCISSPAPLVVPGKKKLLKPLLIGATLGVVALTGFGVLSHKATTEMSRKTETFDQMLDRMNELHQHNDFGSARDMAIRYRNAVMKDPARHNSDRHKQWVADSYLYEGRELLALGDLAGSEYQFQKAVDKYIEVGRKPNDSLFELASVQMKAGKDTAAFKTFGRLETISPNYHLSEVQVLMAALEMRAGKLEQAEKRLQVLSQAEGIDVVAPNGFDTDFAIKAHLATLAFLRQDYAKCKNILIPLVEKSQTPQTLPGSQTFARLAVSCARCGERDLALHYKEKALARAAAEQQLCKTSPDKIVSQQVTRDIKQLFKDSGI